MVSIQLDLWQLWAWREPPGFPHVIVEIAAYVELDLLPQKFQSNRRGWVWSIFDGLAESLPELHSHKAHI